MREVDRVLGLTGALDGHIGAVKKRRRGLSGGQLLMSVASCQMTGGDHLVSLDRRRTDTAGQLLEPAPTPAAGIAARFGPEQLGGIEKAIGQVNTTMVALVGQVRRRRTWRPCSGPRCRCGGGTTTRSRRASRGC